MFSAKSAQTVARASLRTGSRDNFPIIEFISVRAYHKGKQQHKAKVGITTKQKMNVYIETTTRWSLTKEGVVVEGIVPTVNMMWT